MIKEMTVDEFHFILYIFIHLCRANPKTIQTIWTYICTYMHVYISIHIYAIFLFFFLKKGEF